MKLERRVAMVEREVVFSHEDDEPVCFSELASGQRDVEFRRRLGRAELRDAAMKMREFVARCCDYSLESSECIEVNLEGSR